jgi:hypothetical protein
MVPSCRRPLSAALIAGNQTGRIAFLYCAFPFVSTQEATTEPRMYWHAIITLVDVRGFDLNAGADGIDGLEKVGDEIGVVFYGQHDLHGLSGQTRRPYCIE